MSKKHVPEYIARARAAAAGTSYGFGVNDAARNEANFYNQYDLLRLVRTMADPRLGDSADLEISWSKEYERATGRRAQGVFVPTGVLARAMAETRALTVGTGGGSTGGQLVATDLLSQNFIDLLRPKSITARLGVQMLNDLVGNVAIPRQTGGTSAYWVNEADSPIESQATFDQVAMTPKTIGAYTDISRKMMLQSSISAQAFVINDLMNSLAQGIDAAIISGVGLGAEPGGLLANSSIPVVALGTDGAAMTWADVVQMWSTVAGNDADFGNLGFLTNAKVRGKLQQTEKVSGTGKFIWEEPEALSGVPALMSSLVPSNLTKGSGTDLSAMIFGNWSDLLVGQWGVLDITVDQYTFSSSGGVRIVAMQDVDFVVRHPESFVICKDIAT